mgnify:CR=1 FL=1
MIRRPPISTLDRSPAASDVYKRQEVVDPGNVDQPVDGAKPLNPPAEAVLAHPLPVVAVSYTHLRAHETVLDLVCRLLLEKKTQRIEMRQRPSSLSTTLLSTNTTLRIRTEITTRPN